FFSSRRRHTRFSRDWSSDVCSSDLKDIADEVATLEQSVYMDEGRLNVVNDRLSVLYGLQKKHRLETVADLIVLQQQLETKIQARSEERRVGNESRDCWSTHDWQNNG